MADYIYGVHPAREALQGERPVAAAWFVSGAGGPVLGSLLERARARSIPCELVPRERLDRLVRGGVHQGVVLQVGEYTYAPLEELIERAKRAGPSGLLLVLDGLEDPHNLGALARSALAFGAQGLVIPKDRSAAVTPVAQKASAGALSHLPVARVTNLARAIDQLREEAGLWIAGADMAGAKAPSEVDLTLPLALIVGSEGHGIRRLLLERCDFTLAIPMAGPVESLNASVAGGLLLYEVARQRRQRAK